MFQRPSRFKSFVRFALTLAFALLPSSCAIMGLSSDEVAGPKWYQEALAQMPEHSAQRMLASQRETERIQVALEKRELVLGMNMHEVTRLWGHPATVETAGDSSRLNQRWIYAEGVGSTWATHGERIVYFEQGQVVGWESK